MQHKRLTSQTMKLVMKLMMNLHRQSTNDRQEQLTDVV